MADKEGIFINWFVKPFVVSLAVGSVVLLCQMLWDLGSDVNKNIKMLSRVSAHNADEVKSMQESYHKEFAYMSSQLAVLNKEIIRLNNELSRMSEVNSNGMTVPSEYTSSRKPLIINPIFSLPKATESAIKRYNEKLNKELENKVKQRTMERQRIQQIQIK